ncbi:MAG: mandelate racemase/muconate lactonizing enzyme family protein [Chloroflexi bacterium]|nr:mandelate racemase/muconate lactonizing enzyme family protein [Chloroflexota bacterium]
MKITNVRTTPLSLPLRQAYHWGQATVERARTVLVEVETDEGITGIGETMIWGAAAAELSILRGEAPLFVGESPFDIQRLLDRSYRRNSLVQTTRYANQVFAGVEMALWDLIGKAAGQPVHRLMGGSVHRDIQYFGFLQGETPEDLGADARRAVTDGFEVMYVKVGRGEDLDLRIVAAVREAIGDRRLRLDANENWDVLTAIRMINKLAPFNPEFVEQPTPSHSIEALANVRAAVDVPIAADQSVYTIADVYEVCRRRAADVIVLGLHESGGLMGLKKAAAVAEAVGINICVHGVFETGITTCASNQVLVTIPNLDDGNQIMYQLLEEDIVASPDLTHTKGRLGVLQGPGLGFELDRNAVNRAAERFIKEEGTMG